MLVVVEHHGAFVAIQERLCVYSLWLQQCGCLGKECLRSSAHEELHRTGIDMLQRCIAVVEKWKLHVTATLLSLLEKHLDSPHC